MLYRIDVPGPGRLATMAKPRGGDELAGEMAALRAAGVDVLVCALPEDERVEADLVDEPRLATAVGLRFVPVPITDLRLPVDDLRPTLTGLVDDLRAGAFVVTHCWAGIGRSSLLAAGMLVLTGMAPAEAWQRISTARGHQVPDTTEQRDWLTTFAAATPSS